LAPVRAATPAQLIVIAVALGMVGVCTAAALIHGANALTVVTFRALGMVAIFLAWFGISRVRLSLAPRERGIAVGIGVLLSLNNYALNTAIELIPLPLAILVFYLWPAVTTAASWALGRERFNGRGLAGLVLAFLGVALTLNVELGAAQARGVALAAFSAFAWSAVFLLTDHFFRGRDTRPVNLWMIGTAAVLFSAALAITGDLALPQGAAGWSGFAGVPFFYAFGVIGLFAATSQLGPAKVGFYMNFEPIASVMLAALLLGQKLAPVQLAGAALVIAALFLFRPPAKPKAS